jgi:hypothetical protein
MKFLIIFLLPIAMVVTGCASKGFNRGALEEQIGVQKPVVNEKEIKDILSKKPNLPKPFKLAVYFKRPGQKGQSKPKWRWTDQDKDLILQISKELKLENTISEVFPILGNLVVDEDLKSIRIAAAKHNADAVIIVDGAGDMDKYINNWGWSYILLVTTAFVPGSESDTLFLTSASMWDVRNEYLYLSAEAEGKSSETHIALFGSKDEELIEKAKTASLQNLKNNIINMVKGLKK